MLRIHFTRDDLGRIRLANGPDPMWEILLSLHKLADQDGALVFNGWRRQVRRRLPPSAHRLLELAPPRGYSPDFLTPGCESLDEGLDKLSATPPTRVRCELAALDAQRAARGHTAALSADPPRVLRELQTAARRYYRTALAPFWQAINHLTQIDLATRARVLRHHGAESLLAGLLPPTRWRPPVLETPYPTERDLHLDGRGLRLVPSFFCWNQAITLADTALTPVLVYPIEHEPTWPPPGPATPSHRSLAALLGRTRAVVLATIAAGACTTTQLARRAGVSISSASQHAAVLRDAGLITTHRQGNHVVHVATQMAMRLVDG